MKEFRKILLFWLQMHYSPEGYLEALLEGKVSVDV